MIYSTLSGRQIGPTAPIGFPILPMMSVTPALGAMDRPLAEPTRLEGRLFLVCEKVATSDRMKRQALPLGGLIAGY